MTDDVRDHLTDMDGLYICDNGEGRSSSPSFGAVHSTLHYETNDYY